MTDNNHRFGQDDVLRFLDGLMDGDELARFEEAVQADPSLRRLMAGEIDFQAMLANRLRSEGLVQSCGPGGLGRKVVEVFIPTSLFTLPPVLLALVSQYAGDYSSSLTGWRDSVLQLLPITVTVLFAVLSGLWLLARQWNVIAAPIACGIGGVAVLLTSAVTCRVAVDRYTEAELLRREQLFQGNQWVSLTSAYYWPEDQTANTGRPGHDPTPDELRQELQVLYDAGFTGLFLHECRDPIVPRIAKECGFRAVVQAIRVVDPGDFSHGETQLQISRAIAAAPACDAFVLGEFSAREVDLIGLKRELARLRRQTGKPVTTSFLNQDYEGPRGRRLSELEDFTVRGLMRPWTGSEGDPVSAAEAVREALLAFQDDTKPGLLTMVFFPSNGGAGFTEANQDRFFARILESYVPRGVAICFYSSCDRPWAKRLAQTTAYTPAFEAHTGLFATIEEGDRIRFQPKPAALRFLK